MPCYILPRKTYLSKSLSSKEAALGQAASFILHIQEEQNYQQFIGQFAAILSRKGNQPFNAPARIPLMKYCPSARKNTSGTSNAIRAAAICIL